MMNEMEILVKRIDDIIRQHGLFEFHVLSYDGWRLIIAASQDLIYYHKLEIIFEDVFFASGFFGGWHSDTGAVVFALETDNRGLNAKYEIERGNQVFTFKSSDYRHKIVVAAREIYFNTDTVFYYDRQDLKENERTADFVKRQKK